jgi:hypothetical protein
MQAVLRVVGVQHSLSWCTGPSRPSAPAWVACAW